MVAYNELGYSDMMLALMLGEGSGLSGAEELLPLFYVNRNIADRGLCQIMYQAHCVPISSKRRHPYQCIPTKLQPERQKTKDLRLHIFPYTKHPPTLSQALTNQKSPQKPAHPFSPTPQPQPP